MKFLRIIILIVMVVSFLPLEGFCDDHHANDAQEHHCVLACHVCHHLVAPDAQAENLIVHQAIDFSSLYSFQYQAPILEQVHRPPITSI